MNKNALILRGKNLREYLQDYGIRASHQRITIFRYLVDKGSHPSAQTIYHDLAEAIPTLSKTTVYNTVKLFVDKGIVEEITIGGGHEARYDISDPSHGHFRCERCGGITDIPIDLSVHSTAVPSGYSVREVHIHFEGLCDSCMKEKHNAGEKEYGNA